jgi:Uma2 family endonuclease
MRGAFALHRYTFQEYLALEEESPVRHEFLGGEIYAMAGVTPEHAALAAEVARQLGNAVQGSPCRVYSSDLRVRVRSTGLTTYPDVTVICGKLERDPESPTTVTNPVLLVEVTSDSTEAYDRSEKLEHYQTIPSLQTRVLVSHRERLVEAWERRGGAWVRYEARRGANLELAAIAASLEVDTLYRVLGE